MDKRKKKLNLRFPEFETQWVKNQSKCFSSELMCYVSFFKFKKTKESFCFCDLLLVFELKSTLFVKLQNLKIEK